MHLSGDRDLASGICAKVCPNAPDNTKAKIRKPGLDKREGRERNKRKAKQKEQGTNFTGGRDVAPGPCAYIPTPLG